MRRRYAKMTGASPFPAARMRPMDPEDAEVKAAGGVVWRARRRARARSRSCIGRATTTGRCRRASSIPARTGRRPRCARSWEEIGLRCALGDELPPTFYDDSKGRPKAVRYWLMEPAEDGAFAPNDEVDEMRWLDPAAATELLTYDARRRAGPRARAAAVNRDRFPGLRDGWARLDGPAGTQMVDSAIDAMADWMRSGRQRQPRRRVRRRARDRRAASSRRARRSRRCSAAEPRGVVFGPSMTALTMRFAATVGARRSGRATRSSARAWTTTPTCARG